MLQPLTALAEMLANPYTRVPEQHGEGVADNMLALHDALQQLNSVLHFDYAFEDGPPADVIAYARLLEEYAVPCAEKVEFMIDRPGFTENDLSAQYESDILVALLERITHCSVTVQRLITV